MKFEEVLPLMRDGAKAEIVGVSDGSYWVCCYQSIAHEPGGEKDCLSIAKLESDGTHILDRFTWGIPRCAIMAEWKIKDE